LILKKLYFSLQSKTYQKTLKMQKKQFVLLFFILFVSLNNNAQDLDKLLNVQYKPGFVILNTGDTLTGAFEFNDCEQNYHVLVYIDPISTKKTAYEPQQVKYFMLDSLTYMPKELKDGWVFVRLLLYDNLKVYLHKHYITSNLANSIENQIMYEKPNGKFILVTLDRFYPFKTKVGDFFSDDPDLFEKIDKGIYKNNIKDIFKISNEYNDWLRMYKR